MRIVVRVSVLLIDFSDKRAPCTVCALLLNRMGGKASSWLPSSSLAAFGEMTFTFFNWRIRSNPHVTRAAG